MNYGSQAVIGLGYAVVHDSNVVALAKRRLLLAVSEERLSRKKRDGAVPFRALALARSLVDADATVVSSYYDTSDYINLHRGLEGKRRVDVGTNRAHVALLRDLGVTEFVGHHFSHAAGAFYTSGFSDALVVTYDAGIYCDPWLATIWRGRDGELTPIRRLTRADGAVAALRYSGVTSLMGFKPVHDEGKVTGLAAFGTVRESCLNALMHAFANTVEPSDYWNGEFAKKFSWIREQFSMADIAASVQYATEIRVLELISETISDAVRTNCVLAGGLFANVKLNQRIKTLGFKNIYVYPAMGDEGLGLGAALGFLAPRDPSQHRLDHVYLGPQYSEAEMEDALQRSGLRYERCETIEDDVAELLASGWLIARFAGRMEFGPRALGNRSILFQTTDVTVNEWLNKRLQRVEFMPFAPVTLAGKAVGLYENLEGLERCTRFMTVSVKCTDRMKALSPAVVHVDGTARPQLIDRQTNPGYYRILERYDEITGIPSLINTSFNMHQEPIVCSPHDAIRCFMLGSLDYLAMGPFLVFRPR